MLIESLKNPKIKKLLLLEAKKKERKTQNLFVVEGLQENYWALEAGFLAKEFFIYPDIFQNKIKLPEDVLKNFISKTLFEKISYRETSGGIIGLYESKYITIDEIKFINTQPLIVVVDAIEKPGNLGAILRSAEASNVDAVILSDSLLDIYNSNVVRASVGALFLNQVVIETSEKVQSWLKKHQITSYATYLNNSSKSIYNFDLKKPTAFVFGTESTGLSESWLSFCDQKIIIPMSGKIDSLNVSNATTICLFEANRQRNYAN
ncbi:MAG: TrmH family RNA methyltransferase [Solirubrobacteraceae bacterium]